MKTPVAPEINNWTDRDLDEYFPRNKETWK